MSYLELTNLKFVADHVCISAYQLWKKKKANKIYHFVH